ncbi:MAG TPA: bile acid:sodium symporter, partial [Thermodesulfobacteriota bacterium]|nr:bile acid:sodium symporter [Thermodesulfobacteriota bacterium]
MVRKNDLILLLVIFGSMGAGIGFPKLGKLFIPYPLYLQMFLLFLSFLKIDFVEVLKNIRRTSSIVLVLCILKLFIIPVGLFFITHAIWPEYALPVLLLSG